MRKLILMLYIKAIEKYLDLPEYDNKNDKIKDFLINAWVTDGFRQYVTKRNNDLIYDLAGGTNMTAKNREEYIETIGRRVENLYITALAKRAFEADDKMKRGKK